MKLPKKTEEEVHVREIAMEAALQKAVMVPLNLAKKIDSAWETMVELAAVGNITCKSDLQVCKADDVQYRPKKTPVRNWFLHGPASC